MVITPRRGRPPRPALDRFLDHVEFTETCWLWTGHIESNGYGRLWDGSRADGTRRPVGAHRFIYEAVVGPIPDGFTIDHLCRVRHCVNPDHLEAVTARENTNRSPLSNAQKTQCPAGHAYDAANTYVTPRGLRQCRQCKREKKAMRLH